MRKKERDFPSTHGDPQIQKLRVMLVLLGASIGTIQGELEATEHPCEAKSLSYIWLFSECVDGQVTKQSYATKANSHAKTPSTFFNTEHED